MAEPMPPLAPVIRATWSRTCSLSHLRQCSVHKCRLQTQPRVEQRLDDRACRTDQAATATENDDAKRADHRQAQTACTAARCQIVQDNLRSRPFEAMSQDLGLPGSQVPEADPIRNRQVIDPED